MTLNLKIEANANLGFTNPVGDDYTVIAEENLETGVVLGKITNFAVGEDLSQINFVAQGNGDDAGRYAVQLINGEYYVVIADGGLIPDSEHYKIDQEFPDFHLNTIEFAITAKSGYTLKDNYNDVSFSFEFADVNDAPVDLALHKADDSVGQIEFSEVIADATKVGLVSAWDDDEFAQNSNMDNLTYQILIDPNKNDNLPIDALEIVKVPGSNGADATFELRIKDYTKLAVDVNTTFQFQIQVSDGQLSETKTYSIVVDNVNAAPTAIMVDNATTVAVDENVGYTGTLSATDDTTPSASLTYAFDTTAAQGGDAGGMFQIVGNQISLVNPADYEAGQSYKVYVKATDADGATSATQEIVININDVNETPTDVSFINAQAVQAGVTAAGANVVQAGAVDPDSVASGFHNDKFAFLVNGNQALTDGKFTIDADTGQITTNDALTADDVGDHVLHVVTYDAGNAAFTASHDYTVAVAAAANTAPTAIMVDNATTVAVDENVGYTGTLSATDDTTPSASLTYAFDTTAAQGGDAGGMFQIVGNQISLVNPADYEAGQSYKVYVKATDADGATSATQEIVININDVNETPTDVSFINAQAVQAGVTAAGANVVQAGAVDPDSVASGFHNDKFAFLVNGNQALTDGKFTIDADTGQITTNDALTADDVGDHVLHVVTYDAGNAAFTASHDYTVAVAAAPPTPVVQFETTTVSRAEGDNGLTTFTYTLTRTGDDLSGASTVHWAVVGAGDHPADTASDLSGDLAGDITFAAGETTHQITVSVVGDLIPEPDEGFRIDLTAGDNVTLGSNASATGTITNDDTTGNAQPEIGGVPTPVSTAAVDNGDPVSPFGNVTITDDSASVTATITMDDHTKGAFMNVGAGTYNEQAGTYTVIGTAAEVEAAIQALQFDAADRPDAAVGAHEVTTFTIAVTDDGGLSATANSNVSVDATAANRAPTLDAAAANVTIADNENTNLAQPFGAVTIADSNTGDTVTVTIAMDAATKGAFANLGTGTYDDQAGTYTLTGTVAEVQAAVRGLKFNPTDRPNAADGTNEVTTFTINVHDAAGDQATPSSAITVTSTHTVASNQTPQIGGVDAPVVKTVLDTQTATPFADVTLSDDSAYVIASVKLDDDAKGAFATASLHGFYYDEAAGAYTMMGTRGVVEAALKGLVFDPTDRPTAAVDAVETTTFTLTVKDIEGAEASSSAIQVAAHAANRGPVGPVLYGNVARELSATGTVVGTLAASDSNAGDSLTYTLLDNAGGRFKLVGSTLVVDNGFLLDYEQAGAHAITVQVTDGHGGVQIRSFAIGVSDLKVEKTAGSAGNDVFKGGKYNDKLYGGSGNDQLWGGYGRDILKGGAGKDAFVFDTKFAKKSMDKIVDYNVKADSLWFDNALFKSNKALYATIKKGSEHKLAKLSSKFFTVGDHAKDKDDYFVYDKKKGVLYYDQDGSGSHKAVEIAQFKHNTALTAKELFFF